MISWRPIIEESGVFTVSVLGKETPMAFIGLFGFKSGRDLNRFENVAYRPGQTGAPVVLEHAVGYLEAELLDQLAVGTHIVFIGKVVASEITGGGEPITYTYYHGVKKGTAPVMAPTTFLEETGKEAVKMDKYRCTVCNYLYDPETGDPEAGIAPGTPFEDLPDDWVCPLCGVGKEEFEKEG